MPNWCNNSVTINAPKPVIDEIKRILSSEDEGLLNWMRPLPEDQKENWYDWCVSNWGTKWDIHEAFVGDDTEEDSIQFSFDSAWAPPTKAYERLEEQGFAVSAMYYEPGMAFAGRYEDGCDDYYEYGDMSADDVENMLPNDIDEYFGISEGIRDWAESEEEDVPEIDDEEAARAALDELKADYEKLMAEEESAENDQDKR